MPMLSRIARCLCRAALPALALGWAGAATAEDAVLMASTAPGYAPGTVVARGERLSLPEGASVTLLFRSGQMLRLRGPLEASLDPPAATRREGVAAALAEAFRLRGVDASVIGATRATAFGRPVPGEVAVEATRSGTWCVAPQDTVWLVRPPPAEGGTVSLRRRGMQRGLAWPAGAARIEWPQDVPIEDGDRFDVVAEGRVLATLAFRAVAATGGGDSAAIAEGVLLGCHEQYEAALRRAARGVVPPELWLTTDRGRAASFRQGETVGLTAIAGTEGWLACVVRRADGTTHAVFPGGQPARIPASVPVALPGPRGGEALRATAAGSERARCWLADRDIAAELPDALRGAVGNMAEVDAAMSRLTGRRAASAALEWRVE
jgi:hypothetical protein